MKITFLGTGTSQGVPVIACECRVCKSTDARDNRLRTSIFIESDTTRVVIDTGPDFRQQMLRKNVKSLDAVLFTHEHKDHIAGLDDVRAFNYFQQKSMDVYCIPRVQEALKREFAYAFAENSYPGIPKLSLHTIGLEPFTIGDIKFIPIEVMHHKLPVLGFRIKDFTYITDANFISEAEKDKIRGTKTLVLNALRREAHISHFSLDEAIVLSNEIRPEKVYFTHISHQMGLHAEINAELPDFIECAYDGLVVDFN